MGERDRHEHGTFSWTDLSAPDAEASKAFYGGLFGWEFLDNPIPEGGVYVMAKLDGRSAAAMYESTERHPAWASYVTVDDADANQFVRPGRCADQGCHRQRWKSPGHLVAVACRGEG